MQKIALVSEDCKVESLNFQGQKACQSDPRPRRCERFLRDFLTVGNPRGPKQTLLERRGEIPTGCFQK